ncbi:MAG: cytochrome c biogenesis protein DipZ [Alphaproteobacteria bacterium]|nr:cytochrome c biogenesis protein DipZ [Alphaproteobacteria bacterium]
MTNLLVESGLAFLEGVALIVSPCIWPILPLVLSASVGSGGKGRPYGIITGFIVAFAAFAWGARWLVSSIGLDLDIIKDGSLFLLAFFGIVLISESLSGRFSALTQKIAGFGADIATSSKGGFASGIAIGALIGLVWTPCAGPILAAVLVQIIRQQNDINGLIVLVAFAIGAGIPMLLIALTGRAVVNKLGFLKTHAEAVRKGFGVLILLAVAFIASGINPETLLARPVNETKKSETGLIKPVPYPYPAPALKGSGVWLNSKPLTLDELKGKVVLIDFWTYSCINCIRTLPYITKWDKEYRDKGLVVIGVHSPEFAFEKKEQNVKDAIARFGIQYPVMLDNNLDTWVNFSNHYWPAHYLIDKKGEVVYTHFGEGAYNVTEQNIRFLLGMGEAGVPREAESAPFDSGQTPETYLGYGRAANFASKEGMRRDNEAAYSFPYFLESDHWALQGPWRVEEERIVSTGKDARLRLNFLGTRVFLVLGSAAGKPIEAALTLNGEALGAKAGKDAPGGVLKVSENRLYELINQGKAQNGLLEIKTDETGLEAYAFTFGR